MKQIKILLLLSFTFFSNYSFAHQNFWVMKDFGNVKVRVLIGFYYEEINKVFMIGELAEKLAKKYDYKQAIFLDFEYLHLSEYKSKYSISFDKGWKTYKKDSIKKGIIIAEITSTLNATHLLKLLEYSVLNSAKIKSVQTPVDTTIINTILSKPSNIYTQNLLQTKVYRPDKDFKEGISYYWQDNQYNLFIRRNGQTDRYLKSLDKIYCIRKPDSLSTMIFDSDSSFYFFDKKGRISNRQVIQNSKDVFGLFAVKTLKKYKISIRFVHFAQDGLKEKELTYMPKRDKLIQE